MLKHAIEKCPESVWYDPDEKFRIWSKAYHTVFFVHLYLQNAEKDFVEWEKHHAFEKSLPSVPSKCERSALKSLIITSASSAKPLIARYSCRENPST